MWYKPTPVTIQKQQHITDIIVPLSSGGLSGRLSGRVTTVVSPALAAMVLAASTGAELGRGTPAPADGRLMYALAVVSAAAAAVADDADLLFASSSWNWESRQTCLFARFWEHKSELSCRGWPWGLGEDVAALRPRNHFDSMWEILLAKRTYLLSICSPTNTRFYLRELATRVTNFLR